MWSEEIEFSTLLGKVIKKIEVDESNEVMRFIISDDEIYKLYHDQDCCEYVSIEDICGDLDDLIDNPILLSECVESNENPEDIKKEDQDSFTWTFYKLSTIKGSVTIRWYGESNGYYSESVSFIKEETV